MKILWIAEGLPPGPLDQNTTTPFASARYRISIPGKILLKWGHVIEIANPSSLQLSEASTPKYEAVVVPKFLPGEGIDFALTTQNLLRFLRVERGKGTPILCDICDNHFRRSLYDPFQRELISCSDAIVASTIAMSALIRAETGRESFVVGDPVEGAQRSPVFDPPEAAIGQFKRLLSFSKGNRATQQADRLRLLWFGGLTNLDTLWLLAHHLKKIKFPVPISLHIVTAPHENVLHAMRQINVAMGPDDCCRFTPWSPEAMESALHNCDLIVIPSNSEDKMKAVKSPNRLLESIWAGKYVIASPLPSYEEFVPWAWISEDMGAGIRWALNHRNEVIEQIHAGQNHIYENYTPEIIAEKWDAALRFGIDTIRSPSIGRV